MAIKKRKTSTTRPAAPPRGKLVAPSQSFRIKKMGADKIVTSTATLRPHQKGKPCNTASSPTRCSVQLVFKQGQPHLRMCETKGKKGLFIPVSSPADAVATAASICDCYRKTQDFSTCVVPGTPLGRVRRRKKGRR